MKILQPQRKIVIQEPVNEKPPDKTIINEVATTTKTCEATKPVIVKEEEKTKETLNEEKALEEFENKVVENQQDIEPQRVETSSNDQAEVISSIPDAMPLNSEADKQEIEQQVTESPKEIPSQIPQVNNSVILLLKYQICFNVNYYESILIDG